MKILFVKTGFFFLLVLSVTVLSASAMNVYLVLEEMVSFNLNEVEQLTFDEDDLNIHLTSGTSEVIPIENILQITFSEDVSVEEMVEFVSRIPIRFLRNYPNPFNPETTISFELAQKGRTRVEIYNVKGQLIRTLLDDVLDIGSHSLVWNGRNELNSHVSSGVYLYRVSVDGSEHLSKMIMIK